MTLLQIINLIKDTTLAQPNINTFVRNFLDLNREDTVYSAVVLQDRDGNRDRIQEQDWNTFTFHLGYVDRLTFDESNRDDIFSTGINIINNIVASIRQTWFPDIEVNLIDKFNTFDQRFTAQCAGVYVVLSIQIPVSDCVDTEQTDIYDKYEARFTENGHYHYIPDGKPVNEINITIDVTGGGEKPEETLTENITSNGSYSYSPTPGYVFDSANISVDVHPSQSLIQNISSNGVTSISGEWKDAIITVAVSSDQKPEETLTENITSNGSYSYSPTPGYVFDKAEINVDVHPSKSLSRSYTTNGQKTITGEFNGGIINISVHPSTSLSEIITTNGSYSYPGEYAGVDITVAVSSDQKPEESLTQTITSNGSYRYDPTPGSVFDGADITVDVHPSQSLVQNISSNGSHTFTGEWTNAVISVDVHPSQSLVQNISANGVTSLSGEWTDAVITVAVPTTLTVTMTQSQYDALSVKDSNTIYLING